MRFRELAAAFLLTALVAPGAALAAAPDRAPSKKPQTGFEKSNGASWTTHEDELEFLAAVDALSDRVEIDVIGQTKEKRPLHLVQMGVPAPPTSGAARRTPTVLFVCSQHGNEPAGREACLQLLRDLALAEEEKTRRLLERNTLLFVPSANPDGRAANTRGNSDGIDINRDHLNLETAEARAIAAVVSDWEPDVVLDLHEYGPSIPLVYDDELLYLWPRNLNVDAKVHGLSKDLAEGYLEPGAEKAGYSADEYGQYELADNDIHQSAGDGDEGILRNAMGLRHAIGILVESAVTQDPRNGPGEVTDEAEVQRRRVASHLVVAHETLRFLVEKGDIAERETDLAAKRKAEEGRERSAPVYFGGADNQEPAEEDVVDPPPCGYSLTNEQVRKLGPVLSLLGIEVTRQVDGMASPGYNPDVDDKPPSPKPIKTYGSYVRMGQGSEPLIPLLLDERGARHSVAATPDTDCGKGRREATVVSDEG